DARAAERDLDEGRASVFLDLPPDLESRSLAGKDPAVLLAVDGTDANTAGLTLGYAGQIAAEYAREQSAAESARLGRPPGAPPLTLESRAWYNENLESRNFYMPSLLAQIITAVTLMLTAMAIVREREVGTLEQLLVTPIRPLELILGKTLPFATIGVVDAAISLLVVVGYFHVPLRGSLALFFLAVMLYMVTTLSGGLLISTISRTQQQAMMGGFLFLFPAILLSGFMFPTDNMPWPVQWLSYLDPIRYMMDALRALFLKGAGLDLLWPDLAALTGLGVAILAAAVWRFGATLE
ncbi:MAG TPA: ABC transporter permease, partial [Oscillatoriaceae cyanobacterium]